MEFKNGINIKKLHKKSEPGDDEFNDYYSSSDTEIEDTKSISKISVLDFIKFYPIT